MLIQDLLKKAELQGKFVWEKHLTSQEGLFLAFSCFFFVKNKKVQDLQYGHASEENVKMGVAQKNWSLYLEKSELLCKLTSQDFVSKITY